MTNRCSNVRYEQNKVIISIKGIEDSLKGFLSDEDIRETGMYVKRMRQNQEFLTLITSKTECMCGDGCAYSDKKNKSVPYGNYHSDVVFIRKMPTEAEQAGMLSHSDAPGYMLFTALRKMGFCPEDFYFTDFMKCSTDGQIDPRACIHCMNSFLLKELAFVNPKLIIAEGSEVMSALNARVFESKVKANPGFSEVTTVLGGTLVNAGCIFDTALILKETDPSVLEQKKHGLWVQINTLLEQYKKGECSV